MGKYITCRIAQAHQVGNDVPFLRSMYWDVFKMLEETEQGEVVEVFEYAGQPFNKLELAVRRKVQSSIKQLANIHGLSIATRIKPKGSLYVWLKR